MEEKLVEKKDEGKEGSVSPEVVCPAKTIAELATQLENGVINATFLSDRARRGCALFFKSLRYENADIAVMLDVGIRQVQHYLRKSKEEIALALGPDFQKTILEKIMKRWDARIQRMIRLSHAKDLSNYEKARIIGMCHQIDMDNMALLEKYGYLNRERSKIDIEDATATRENESKERYRHLLLQLTTGQHKQYIEYVHGRIKELNKMEEEFKEHSYVMLEGFIAENKKEQSLEDEKNQNRNPPDKAVTN